jgi:hypothetical protein
MSNCERRSDALFGEYDGRRGYDTLDEPWDVLIALRPTSAHNVNGQVGHFKPLCKSVVEGAGALTTRPQRLPCSAGFFKRQQRKVVA